MLVWLMILCGCAVSFLAGFSGYHLLTWLEDREDERNAEIFHQAMADREARRAYYEDTQ